MTPLMEERKRRGWSRSLLQSKLASLIWPDDDRSVISIWEIGRWERGESVPRDYWIEKICELFEKTAEELGLHVPIQRPEALRPAPGQPRADQSSPLPESRHIVGRQGEVRLFDEILEGSMQCVLLNIYGPGGIGKTIVRGLMAKHAALTRIPLGIVDCGDPSTTPDRILFEFWQSLMNCELDGHIEAALNSFNDQIRTFQIINRVLQHAGGMDSLYDSLGNVKDLAGFSVTIGGLEENSSAAVARILRNRFTLDRYLRGAEQALTDAFVQGIGTVADQSGRSLVLIMDGYEALDDSPTESWVCRELMAKLPATARLIILGRNSLPRVNFDWQEHDERMRLHALPELEQDEALAYLQSYGLTDPVLLHGIYSFTGGYPLLLMLVRYLAQELGSWERIDLLAGSADRDHVATQLLTRILKEERVEEVRSALEKGVVAAWLDPGALAVLLEVSDEQARAVYDRLQRHSFVERHPRGIRFHDKIRERLLDRLKFTNMAEYTRLAHSVEEYFRSKSGEFVS
jgi:hypothetical protein